MAAAVASGPPMTNSSKSGALGIFGSHAAPEPTYRTAQDDKGRRMRAFLSCMRSDTPLMLNTSYVPQHLLILATVLRYIMTSQVQILRRQELDAFLATAFSSDLMNALHLQEMIVNGISSRGVQLGALVMAGAEAALLANDACGAPVPWLVAAPWLYFDGKLLQRNLQRANHCKHLAQLCDNHLDTVVKVERMRKAILEGLEVEFAMPPLPLTTGMLGMGAGYGTNYGALGWSGGRGRGRGNGGGGGARLEIAGVVVGQWGGSYPSRTTRYGTQVNYVGYTPTPRNAYSARGWRGARGRGRGARSTRGGRKPRRDQTPVSIDEPAKQATLTINGKTIRSNEVTTSQIDEMSPQEEDNILGDSESNEIQSQKSETSKGPSKNVKKTIGKGKKKNSNVKMEGGQPLETMQLDKNKTPEHALGDDRGDEHIGQGDAPATN
ncbi:Constitutive coactivator of PPAR-gamma-like protein 1 homolog [Eumeta japonica]|uniref:Constitutive coactivator of PPAR-gamma-like protein 1 homolog n=1 Tax=Eumeta variegata TaxID=151549 RepID=A0A4C1STA3_EUMVA|nr:Constitutive coactivator of PPAR-gamma-like protein 1 homolog [Eumeta japonica]